MSTALMVMETAALGLEGCLSRATVRYVEAGTAGVVRGGRGCSAAGSSGSSGGNSEWPPAVECCVCLCRFEAEEEVSELSCKHFFHKGCLDKWFDNQHITCPLCRSIM
ncbi:UNVERIFIED_CONTAM: E3 ubiquitin-protein ligase [Sesamum radiatum]|uniref:E3 ubiquitin-protein ligase n=1 Tax=Sesamum radiatum TaxID=300843 RepID=A0AAW2MXZ2_SESRA